jgi:DNA-binding CsgD family transcriptional regulator
VLAIEQKLGEPVEPAVVRDILQLTLGEARVAAFVGAGLSTAATASRLNIQVDTARTVLERVSRRLEYRVRRNSQRF